MGFYTQQFNLMHSIVWYLSRLRNATELKGVKRLPSEKIAYIFRGKSKKSDVSSVVIVCNAQYEYF